MAKSSFVITVIRGMRPLEGDKRFSKEEQNSEVDAVLFLQRSDGYVGLPGGGAEEGESPIKTALREYHEEVGYLPYEHQLEHLSSYEDVDIFVMEVSPFTGSIIEKSVRRAEHFLTETTGWGLVFLTDHHLEVAKKLPWVDQRDLALFEGLRRGGGGVFNGN